MMSDLCNAAVGCELIGNRPRLNAVEGQVDRADIAVDRDSVAEAVRRANTARRGDIGVIPDLRIYAADGDVKPLDKLVIAYHISKGRRFCPLGAAPHDIADERILLIDDEALVARMQARLLESLGYTVTDETDPLQALKLFASTPESYDLIITDMTMPKMNGASLTGEILKIRPDIPVVLCTGFSELVNEAKARSLGVKAFAMKPLIRKSIAEIVRKALAC